MDTLLLNGDHNPISILPLSVINWQHAVKLYFMGRVEILEEYDDWVIHSEKFSMKVPSICVTKNYFHFKKSAKFSRANMYLRDMYQCQYCGDVFDAKSLTLDHVIPKSQGGKTTWENSVSACKPCNYSKGASSTWKPLRPPYKPDHYQLIRHWREGPVHVRHHSWYEYLGIKPVK